MNAQPTDLEQRVIALERRLRRSTYVGAAVGGILGLLLGWTFSLQVHQNDVDDHFWVRNSADDIMVEMAASSRGGGGQLSVNGPGRTALFRVYPYEDEELGVTLALNQPDGSRPAVTLHGRDDGGEIVVWGTGGEKVSLWGGGTDTDGEPVSVVERLARDVAALKRQRDLPATD